MRYNEALNLSLHELMQEDGTVYMIGEDLHDPYGGAFRITKGLSNAFPDRVISTPISEAAIVGLATGMAMQGLKPIVEIMFGDFITLCMDQIINGASKFVSMFDMDIPMIIRTPMGGYRGYGPTHSQSLEHLFLNIPNISVLAPSIFHDVGSFFQRAFLFNHPVVVIENKMSYPVKVKVYKANNFDVVLLPYGDVPDVTLITYGGGALLCQQAAHDVFWLEEISVRIVVRGELTDVFTPQCIGKQTIWDTDVIIVSESRGWADSIASALYPECRVQIIQSAKEVIPASKILETTVLPSVDQISEAIYNVCL